MMVGSIRRLAALAGFIGVLVLPSAAEATISSIPNGAAGNIACTVQGGANAGERWCSGIFTTFDGSPIDINVGFPPAPATGPDGNFPIIGEFHGWASSKFAVSGEWVDNGYAYFSMSDRGWGNSCGATDPKKPMPVCANGYNHLMDTRFEVRDAQEIFEALADRPATGATNNEGLIDPQKIGVFGGSYGGGLSIALGTLKDRKLIKVSPTQDSLIPWQSPGGKNMRIAAAQPDIPWTDLPAALQPNGHTLDYVADAPYLERGRIGVEKSSWTGLLYLSGQILSNYAAPGSDPDADLTTWFARIAAGEPYDSDPASLDVVDELTTHHSSYYIDDSEPPAPLLISNGWTDDLFPTDEAIRFYNRSRTNYPNNPIALLFSDHGHQRGQNKGPDGTLLNRQRHNWFDYYVKGTGSAPFLGVTALTQACGGPSGSATGPYDDPNTDTPFRATTWRALAPGEVRYSSAPQQTIQPTAVDENGQTFDPIAGGGACATASGSDQTGMANYRFDAAPAGGYTLMGAPTIVADINSVSPTAQISARLFDLSPSGGDETLIARGIYRPEINTGAATTRQVFQLHPNGWKVQAGHVVKLELMPSDAPYDRPSNGQLPVNISNLELRLPVLESPGTGVVQYPAAKVLPAGYELARDYALDGYARPRASTPLNLTLVPAYDECTASSPSGMEHGAPLAVPSCSPPTQSSDYLTIGTPDANGESPNSNGLLSLSQTGESPINPNNGDQADVGITVSMSDVFNQSGTTEYTGELRAVLGLRTTDRLNGQFEDYPGTASDATLAFNVSCASTVGPEGGTCNVTTTADAVLTNLVQEGKRTVWGLESFELYDGGSDGDADTTGDNTLFAVPGLFAP